MSDRDRQTLRDQYEQAKSWLARAAARLDDGQPNRTCTAHVHMADCSRAIANAIGLLLSDRISAIDAIEAIARESTRARRWTIGTTIAALASVAALVSSAVSVYALHALSSGSLP